MSIEVGGRSRLYSSIPDADRSGIGHFGFRRSAVGGKRRGRRSSLTKNIELVIKYIKAKRKKTAIC